MHRNFLFQRLERILPRKLDWMLRCNIVSGSGTLRTNPAIRQVTYAISELASCCVIIYFLFFFYLTAPGTYSPEKVNLDRGPQYSLAGRGSTPKPDDIPGMQIFKIYFLSKHKFSFLLHFFLFLFVARVCRSTWHVQSRKDEFRQRTAVQFDRKRSAGEIKRQSGWISRCTWIDFFWGSHARIFPLRYTIFFINNSTKEFNEK